VSFLIVFLFRSTLRLFLRPISDDDYWFSREVRKRIEQNIADAEMVKSALNSYIELQVSFPFLSFGFLILIFPSFLRLTWCVITTSRRGLGSMSSTMEPCTTPTDTVGCTTLINKVLAPITVGAPSTGRNRAAGTSGGKIVNPIG
jgi:hypothetical protein